MEAKDKLLVRVYDVGFGDCVYVRVPDNGRHFHMLIDCGSIQWQDTDKRKPKKTIDKLERALTDVFSMLPKDQGSTNKWLDLLVVTHPHADHFNGFDPALFKGITIGRVWLSVFMNKGHPEARGVNALQALTYRATLSLTQRGVPLGTRMVELLKAKQDNEKAEKVLTEILSSNSELYLWRDIASSDPENKKRLEPEEWKKLQPQLENIEFEDGTTCFKGFHEGKTCLRVLAPEWNIDREYLGKEASDYQALVERDPDDYPLGTKADDYRILLELDKRNRTEAGFEDELEKVPHPSNISPRDFRTLRSRLFYSALSFTGKEHEIVNNTSVVLKLEWRGRRLLFVGDAQWRGEYKEGRHNGCWEVMFDQDDKLDESKRHLSSPLDFLKVGHHASENATPWDVDHLGAEYPRLDAILPKNGEAMMVVSTCKTKRWDNVPSQDLLTVLGKRGKVLLTNNSDDLNYPKSNPFAIQVTFDSAASQNT